MATSKPTPKPTPKPKVKGAIIQGKDSKKFYNEGRKVQLENGTLSSTMKKSNAKTYKNATKILKTKSATVIERPGIQMERAYAAGRMSVDNARKTKKVSGPKSKRGN